MKITLLDVMKILALLLAIALVDKVATDGWSPDALAKSWAATR